jgi:exodeoxyribonuclease V beta subunit
MESENPQPISGGFCDEFQDTDDCSGAYSATFFSMTKGAPDNRLFLIGDPKQAIYAFRGADVFTYLECPAADQSIGRHGIGQPV